MPSIRRRPRAPSIRSICAGSSRTPTAGRAPPLRGRRTRVAAAAALSVPASAARLSPPSLGWTAACATLRSGRRELPRRGRAAAAVGRSPSPGDATTGLE
ncbi:unnamed protein product [Urochloa humidicola]